MVALPFRADQPANAKLAKERGLAEVLEPKKLGKRSVYPPGVLVPQGYLGKFGKKIDSKSAAILKKGTWRSSQESIYITCKPPEFTKMLIVLQNHILVIYISYTYNISIRRSSGPVLKTLAATQKCGSI